MKAYKCKKTEIVEWDCACERVWSESFWLSKAGGCQVGPWVLGLPCCLSWMGACCSVGRVEQLLVAVWRGLGCLLTVCTLPGSPRAEPMGTPWLLPAVPYQGSGSFGAGKGAEVCPST